MLKKKILRFASPLRYPGGKARFAPKLMDAVQRNFTPDEKIILVEPYAGGAGASLSLLFSGAVNKIIINDLDRAIYAFWKIAVSDSDYLINRIKRTKINIKEWQKQKAIYQKFISGGSVNERNLAFATLFLNRTNRSGIMNAGPIGGVRQSGQWKLDSRFNKKAIIERLEMIKTFRYKIEFRCLDGIKLLKQRERRKDANRHFIFLDPPYFQKGQSLYLNHYQKKDHEKLSTFLRQSSFKKWLMIYDDVPYIRNLYRRMSTKKLTVRYSAHRHESGNEVVIYPQNAAG